YKWLKESLDRLSTVNFKYEGRMWSGTFNLLSFRLNEETHEYDIFINPISAHSVWSQTASYTFIHRQERHLLKADASKAFHSYLSGVVRNGETRHLAIDTVIKAVWAVYDDEISNDLFRFRTKQISESCKELSKLDGWIVTMIGKGKKAKVKIVRKGK
ncbi:replication protein C, IncQ-type, partial [Vibrio parahaemolyticus]|nr:replication protein C, IncQ-type [Vibrio parahaemolyticus]